MTSAISGNVETRCRIYDGPAADEHHERSGLRAIIEMLNLANFRPVFVVHIIYLLIIS